MMMITWVGNMHCGTTLTKLVVPTFNFRAHASAMISDHSCAFLFMPMLMVHVVLPVPMLSLVVVLVL